MEGISLTLLSLRFFWERTLRQIEKECRWTDTKGGLDTVVGIVVKLTGRAINLTTDHTEVVKRSPLHRPLHIPLQILPPNSSELPYFQSSSYSLQRNSVIMSASSRGRLTHVRVHCRLWKDERSLECQPHHPQDLFRGRSNGVD